MNGILVSGLAALVAVAQVSRAADAGVALSAAPLVLRMSKDEFRIAFGIHAPGCATSGCHGVIRYRVSWRAEDGTTGRELKQVSYAVVPDTDRSLAVDRQYFDTAEAQHTTDITSVNVERITCHPGPPTPSSGSVRLLS